MPWQKSKKRKKRGLCYRWLKGRLCLYFIITNICVYLPCRRHNNLLTCWNLSPDSPLSSQQRPHVVSQQHSPQLTQSQCVRSGCVGFRVQGRTVEHHTALPLTWWRQVLCGSTRQDGPECCGPVHPHPQPFTHHLPTSHRENPTATEGQHPGHHRWRDLGGNKEQSSETCIHANMNTFICKWVSEERQKCCADTVCQVLQMVWYTKICMQLIL